MATTDPPQSCIHGIFVDQCATCATPLDATAQARLGRVEEKLASTERALEETKAKAEEYWKGLTHAREELSHADRLATGIEDRAVAAERALEEARGMIEDALHEMPDDEALVTDGIVERARRSHDRAIAAERALAEAEARAEGLERHFHAEGELLLELVARGCGVKQDACEWVDGLLAQRDAALALLRDIRRMIRGTDLAGTYMEYDESKDPPGRVLGEALAALLADAGPQPETEENRV